MEVLTYAKSLCNALEIDYRLYTIRSHRDSIVREVNMSYHKEQLDKIAEGSYDFGIQFILEEGRKYYKVVMVNHGNKSSHAFIDKNDGAVYKSASWKSPAKGVRYNLLDAVSREECYRKATWSGGYLYAR